MIKELFFDRIYQQLIKEEENVLLSGFVCVRRLRAAVCVCILIYPEERREVGQLEYQGT